MYVCMYVYEVCLTILTTRSNLTFSNTHYKRTTVFMPHMRIDLNITILRHNLSTNQSLSRPP